MTDVAALAPVYEALAGCDETLRELEAHCCEPSRDPDMEMLGRTFAEARDILDRLDTDPGEVEEVGVSLERAGVQVRRLQAECCAPGRMPFFAMILEDLTSARQALDRAGFDGD